MRCVGFALHGVFVFRPAPGGESPHRGCGENNEKGWRHMKRRQKAAWFLSGVAAAALTASLTSPALATLAAKTIQVYTGVDIYVDDQKLEPTDANGNPVEAFVHNGTTYLPVRAVSEAVGKPVQWEPKTNSVYLGEHTADRPAVWLQDLDYFTGKELRINTAEKDNLGNTRQEVIVPYGGFDNTYLLNGQYSAISGTFFQRYDYRSDGVESELLIYGDGELLYSAEVGKGMKPIDFYVDLTGVLELKIDFNPSTSASSYESMSALDDVGLWT